MKSCYNCKGTNRDTDIYCRNCGYKMQSSGYYVLINVGTILSFLALLFVIALFIASFIVD